MTIASLEQLQREIPPPANPIYAAADWSAIETALGWKLPSDYKSFIESYGSGGFFPVEVFVWNLCHSVPDHDRIVSHLQPMEDVESGTPFSHIHTKSPVYLWGEDGIGCKYFWAREGEPDNWSVIVTMGRLDFRRFPDLSMSDFLVKLLVDRDEEIATLLWDDAVTGPIEFRASE